MNISIQNINKHFGQYHALNNINLNIDDGELTALLGPSGCGKSTLLRVIAGLESEDSGKILFDNDDITQLSVQQRNIGFVFQNYALFRHMNIADNIAFGLKVKSRKDRPSDRELKERVKKLLELVQLEHLAQRYPDQLSGGQRQRIALARAIAPNPKVLLLDEPFSALDAKVRKQLRRWLRDFHHEINITTIFVTHDQEEALEVSDKIVLMNQGVIEQIGTPEEVYKQPKSAFVAHFLGDVNLLYGYIHNNELHLGGFVKKLAKQYLDYQSIIAYVRPHEIYATKTVQDNSIVGKITKLHLIGPTVLLEIKIDNSTSFEASISYFEFEKERYEVGDIIYFKPSLVNIFMQDELVEFII